MSCYRNLHKHLKQIFSLLDFEKKQVEIGCSLTMGTGFSVLNG